MENNNSLDNLFTMDEFEKFFDLSELSNMDSTTNTVNTTTTTTALPPADDDRIVSLDSPQGSPDSAMSPASPALASESFIYPPPPASPDFNQLESGLLPSASPDYNLYGYELKENFPQIKQELQNSPQHTLAAFPQGEDTPMGTVISMGDEEGTNPWDTLLTQQIGTGDSSEADTAVFNLLSPNAVTVTDNELLSFAEVSSTSNMNINSYFSQQQTQDDLDLEKIISSEDLLTISVKELNRRLAHQPKPIQTRLKAKRRTLKNRGYAHNCREKRVRNQTELEQENVQLSEQLQQLSAKHGDLQRRHNHALKVLQQTQTMKRENDTNLVELNLLRGKVTNLRLENHMLRFGPSAGSPASSDVRSPGGLSLEDLCQ